MRARIAVAIPVETTADQLAAVASLAEAIAGGRWEHLGRSFTRMDAARAVISPSMSAVLFALADRLRKAGQERADLAAVDDLVGP